MSGTHGTTPQREFPGGIRGTDFPSPNMIPHSIMPRLHVLAFRKLSASSELSFHPFISEGFASPSPRGMQALVDARLAVPRITSPPPLPSFSARCGFLFRG
eukprot:1174496-Rhodomonas_salina.1